MRLSDNELKKQLKSKDFQRVYLIYGEEKLLVKNMTSRVEKALGVDDPAALSFRSLGYTAEVGEISSAVEAMPFLSRYNVVRLSDFNVDALRQEDFDAFLTVVKNTPDTTVFIITMPTLAYTPKKPKKNAKGKSKGGRMEELIAAVDAVGAVVEEKPHEKLGLEQDLVRWASAGGCSMTRLTAAYLIERMGADAGLHAFNAELKKLTAYADGEEITREMIDLLVSKSDEAKIYTLFDAVIAGNADRALRTLSGLYAQKIDPVTVVSVLSGSYVEAYCLRVGSDSGLKDRETALALGLRLPDWKAERISRAARRISTSSLRKSVDVLTETQVTLISTAVNAKVEVEKLLMKLIMLTADSSDE